MPTKYQPPNVRENIKRTLKQKKALLEDPVQSRYLQNPDRTKKEVKKMEAHLESITPPEISGEEGKALMARKRLLEEALRGGSPQHGIVPINTRRQQEDNPDYSTRNHMRWESQWSHHTIDNKGQYVKAKNGYGAKFELKDINYRINRDNDIDPGSIEYLRPDVPEPLANMHVPVSFALSNKAKENYDEMFPDHEPTAMEKKLKDLEEKLAAAEKKVSAAKPEKRRGRPPKKKVEEEV